MQLAAQLAVYLCLAGTQAPAAAQPQDSTQLLVTAEQRGAWGIDSTVLGSDSLQAPVFSMATVAYDDMQVVHVFSPVSGIVLQLTAGPGERVAVGAPLAMLSSADMGAAKADLDRANASLAAATQDVERQKKLFAQHATSARDLESARDAFRRSQAERARAEQQFALLSGGQQQVGNQNYVLRSPLAGEVMSRSASLGTQVQGQYAGGTGAELFTIANLDKVWLLANIHENDVARLRIGATVRLRGLEATGVGPAPANGNVTTVGVVHWISDVVDPQSHTLQVRCSFDNKDQRLRPNMKVGLEIQASADKQINLDAACVLRIDAQPYVFVDGGARPDGSTLFRLRPVEVEDSNDDDDSHRVVVQKGIVQGERIVCRGGARLLDALAKRSAP